MGTYVLDNYVKSYMDINDCTFEVAWAATHKDPNGKSTFTIPKSKEYEALIDLSFKKHKDIYKKRNKEFYALLAPNHEVIVACIMRGKDIYYDVPKRYEMNSNHPFVLNWLLMYSRPEVLSKVRTVGKAKLHTIYTSLSSWVDKHPEDVVNWIYKQEWDLYFNESTKNVEKVIENWKKPIKVEETPMTEMKDILPELEFFEKVSTGQSTTKPGDVKLWIKSTNGRKTRSLFVSFRKRSADVFKSEAIVFAVLNNRIYFKESDVEHGYKLASKVENTASKMIQMVVTQEREEKLKKFLDKELYLKFDESYQLHYVEVEEC